MNFTYLPTFVSKMKTGFCVYSFEKRVEGFQKCVLVTVKNCKRKTAMRMLCQLNPHATSSRTLCRFIRCTYYSMGPNSIWDRYNKLKPFGTGIYGCVDWFCRKIMWLKCGPSNNTLFPNACSSQKRDIYPAHSTQKSPSPKITTA